MFSKKAIGMLSGLWTFAPSINIATADGHVGFKKRRLLDEGGMRDSNTNQPPQSIIGGSEFAPGSRPYLVSVGTGESGYYGQFCGGSLISPHAVMTAAHCLFRPRNAGLQWQPPEWVEFHRHDLFNDTGVVRMYLKDRSQCDGDIAYHPGFDYYFHPGTWYSPFDVAILFLPTAVNNITPVTLNENNKVPASGAPLDVSGWGYTEYGWLSVPSSATVEYVTNKACTQKPYKFDENLLTESMMCAGEKGKGFCYLDGGGPLVLDSDEPKGKHENPVVQVGIVGGGPRKCARPSFPGIYTRVSEVADWVKDSVCARTGELCKNSKSGKNSKVKKYDDKCAKLPTYAPITASYVPTVSTAPTTLHPSYSPTTAFPTWVPTEDNAGIRGEGN
eukprot:CCRYP_004938-RA/>CCRYP_004938-RA protein AED:0.09 eAED:0.08 QI:0/0/0/0.66/1/1/3/0/387